MSIFTQYHAVKKTTQKKTHQSNHIIQSQMVVQNDVSNFPASDRPEDVASGPGCRCSVSLDEIEASARDPQTLPSNILKYTIVVSTLPSGGEVCLSVPAL